MRLFLLVALVVVLAVTNPGPDAFADFAEDNVADQLEARLDDVPGAGLLSGIGSLAAGELVKRFAERDNYLVASVYTLDLDGRAREAEHWRFLGVAGLFVEIGRPASL
ncbi:MAG: DUF4359 domain-containing protein [Bacteroidota bacterium]